MSTARFIAPEAIFDPAVCEDYEAYGIQDMTHEAVQKCDIDIRLDLYANIILNGGSTLFPGVAERLETEVQKKVPKKGGVKVHAPEDRFF